MIKSGLKTLLNAVINHSINRNVSILYCGRQKSDPKHIDLTFNVPDYVDFDLCSAWDGSNHDYEAIKRDLINDMRVIPDFVCEGEEESFIKEIEPYMKKLRYEFDHWDNAIHGFRETERLSWNEANSATLKRAKEIAEIDPNVALMHVHILDLDPKGFIKPHVDSVRFCGDTVAGICLLSPAVMRLQHTTHTDLFADFLLSRRCFYIMTRTARYDYTHEVLKADLSCFKEKRVDRGRRISLISRSQPDRNRR